MFPRAIATLYFIFSLAILAVAMPGGAPPPPPVTTTKVTTITVTAPAPAPTGGSACSTGPIQCCNSVTKVSFPTPLHSSATFAHY